MTGWNKTKKTKCNKKNYTYSNLKKKTFNSILNIRARHVRYSGAENLSHIETIIHTVPNKIVINR
jgi:hypothetical protein